MRYYTKTHEWIQLEEGSSSVARVGITDHGQEKLGDVVGVSFPEVGQSLEAGDSFMEVESVKAASDVYAPVAGTILELNIALDNQPELVNESAEETGYLVRFETKNGLEGQDLMDHQGYLDFLSSQS